MLRLEGWDRSCLQEELRDMRSKGAALVLTLPGVEDQLLAAVTYATGDPALGEQKVETAATEAAKCDVSRSRPRSGAPNRRLVVLELGRTASRDTCSVIFETSPEGSKVVSGGVLRTEVRLHFAEA
jgi:hypothetical protein